MTADDIVKVIGAAAPAIVMVLGALAALWARIHEHSPGVTMSVQDFQRTIEANRETRAEPRTTRPPANQSGGPSATT